MHLNTLVLTVLFLIFSLPFLVNADTCIVEKVVDGDTLWCTFEDRSTKIRLLAVDAPENTFGKNECYADEATQWLSNKVLDKKITLQYDKDEPTYGHYNRLLAYIILDGENINFELIKNGYARALTKYPIHRYSIEIIQGLEKNAKEENAGLWRVCN